MSDIESYDGLCGIIAPFSSSDMQLRCKYDITHEGNHSWEKYRHHFIIQSSCGPGPADPQDEFVNSVISSIMSRKEK